MDENRILALILALFICLGISYALVTPVFEASDELWHYPMIRHLADGNALPVQVFDPDQAGPWKQEASQPPLYYYLGAALTFWIDAGDMEQVRRLNPHVDNGVITPDGNVNLAIHDPDWSRWRGTLLAVRVVRLFSVLLGTVTVYLTYLIAKEVVPERSEIALGATAVHAFTPMYLFISGAVNNDNLAIMLASLGVLMLIRTVTHDSSSVMRHPSPRNTHNETRNTQHVTRWLLIGAVIGLAVLTKQGTIALLPLAWGTAFIARWRAQDVSSPDPDRFWARLGRALLESFFYFGLILISVLLIAGWWYWRNIRLYGDLLGWSAFIAVLGSRAQPASLAQLWDERWGFMLAYWGLFGGVNVPMSTWIYHVLNGVVVAGVLGFPIYLGKLIRRWRQKMDKRPFSLPSLLSGLLDVIVRHFPLVVCLLFALAVVIGLIRWATTTWSSQGRLVFTAISALNVLLVVGVAGWMPRRLAKTAVSLLAVFMFIIAALAPWLWIRPVYEVEAAPQEALPQTAEVTFGGGKIELEGYEVEKTAVQPGETLTVRLDWQYNGPFTRDWSVFVHLNDPVLGAPIAQRDMYPANGLRPTTLIETPTRFRETYQLRAPETAVAPAELELVVGFYDFETGERLRRPDGSDAAQLAAISLRPVPGEYPNVAQVNFMNQVDLVGFALEPRRTAAGETFTLTLYARAKRPLSQNYTIFAQVLGEANTRWAAQDLAPQPGTAAWPPDEVQTVNMNLRLAADTPPGVYPLILGLYTRTEDGGFNRLQLVTADGRITQDDMLTLTQIRVE